MAPSRELQETCPKRISKTHWDEENVPWSQSRYAIRISTQRKISAVLKSVNIVGIRGKQSVKHNVSMNTNRFPQFATSYNNKCKYPSSFWTVELTVHHCLARRYHPHTMSQNQCFLGEILLHHPIDQIKQCVEKPTRQTNEGLTKLNAPPGGLRTMRASEVRNNEEQSMIGIQSQQPYLLSGTVVIEAKMIWMSQLIHLCNHASF